MKIQKFILNIQVNSINIRIKNYLSFFISHFIDINKLSKNEIFSLNDKYIPELFDVLKFKLIDNITKKFKIFKYILNFKLKIPEATDINILNIVSFNKKITY